MNAIEALQDNLQETHNMVGMYLGDLSDADLLVRPAPSANHIAWQLGHLILSERQMLKDNIPGVEYAQLPAGFHDQHDAKNSQTEPPYGFLKKADYLELFKNSRAATVAAVSRLTESDLDAPTVGVMAQFAPTLGKMLNATAIHTMMHAGQFSAVRRKLGKPVLF